MARLARQRRHAADSRRLRGFRAAREGRRISPTPCCSAWADRASAPKCWRRPSAKQPGFPQLHVLDSTDPAQIRAIEAHDRPRQHAVHRVEQIRQHDRAERHEAIFLRPRRRGDRRRQGRPALRRGHRSRLVAGEGRAQARASAASSTASPRIGGRYSVLSPFGLVPAAAAGIDIRSAARAALAMVRSCGADVPPDENPGVQLGARDGRSPALEGRDKVTIVASPRIADFGAWAEQLLAESTGKDGKGLIPVDGEPLGAPAVYGNDRFFIDICAPKARTTPRRTSKLAALEAGRASGGAHRHEIDRPYRPGILPLRDGDRGRRRDPRHQSVRPARRRGHQGQDPRTDRGVREDRRAAAGEAGVVDRRRPISSPTTAMPPRCARPAPTAISAPG